VVVNEAAIADGGEAKRALLRGLRTGGKEKEGMKRKEERFLFVIAIYIVQYLASLVKKWKWGEDAESSKT